ncbi:MAG: 3-phosphoshikimate 1-carboxyvinyltransferase, partial [Bacteroidota bacterium]
MTVLLSPPEHPIRGTIALPLSKSESNRALIMQALSNGHIHLDRVSAAQDVQTMQRLLSMKEGTLDAGPAGTTFRFLTAYFAITPGMRILTGSERLQQRPVGILVEALRHLGAQIEYLGHEGYPPLRITGQRLKGGTVDLDTSVSSQFLSALLMIAPTTRQGLTINLTGQSVSQPYAELTIRMMAHFGVEVARGDRS